MEKKAKSKLVLNKETVRNLDAAELQGVAGGDSANTNCVISDCICDLTLNDSCFCTFDC